MKKRSTDFYTDFRFTEDWNFLIVDVEGSTRSPLATTLESACSFICYDFSRSLSTAHILSTRSAVAEVSAETSSEVN